MDLRDEKLPPRRLLICLLSMCLGILVITTYQSRYIVQRSATAERSRTEARAVLSKLHASSEPNELSVLIETRLQEVADQDAYCVWAGADDAGAPIVLAAVTLDADSTRAWSYEPAPKVLADASGTRGTIKPPTEALTATEYLQRVIADDLTAYARLAGEDARSYMTTATQNGVIVMVAPEAARVVANLSLILEQDEGLPLDAQLNKLIATI